MRWADSCGAQSCWRGDVHVAKADNSHEHGEQRLLIGVSVRPRERSGRTRAMPGAILNTTVGSSYTLQ